MEFYTEQYGTGVSLDWYGAMARGSSVLFCLTPFDHKMATLNMNVAMVDNA